MPGTDRSRLIDEALEWPPPTAGGAVKHFLPYGAYVAACGRISDDRYPERWTDQRRLTTCAECQAQMTDLGDLPTPVWEVL
jgi:hypothetical protein